MIKLLFDWDAVVRNPYSGFYTFGTELISTFIRLRLPLSITLFYQKKYDLITRRYLTSENISDNQLSLVRTQIKFRWLENIWKYLPYPALEFFTGNFNIYHCFHHFMPRVSCGKRILTVHDLRRYRLPNLYKKSNLHLFELAVKRADYFITVSHSTKKDLCNIFNIESKRVSVVPLACKKREIVSQKVFEIQKKLKEEFNCKEFALAISSKDNRKNIPRIIRAFVQARKEVKRDIDLVIIGEIPDANYSYIEENKGIYAAGLVDDVLPWMKASKFFIFASLYEGFGLPILEAFWAGTPVITSSCSSMPEVAGKAALFVKPEDEFDLKAAIIELMLNGQKAIELVEEGKKRIKEFSWEKTAKRLFDIYKKLYRSDKQKEELSDF